METELYSLQKKKLSELQGCFHKFVNTIKTKKKIDENDFVSIYQINNQIDIALSLITEFNSGNNKHKDTERKNIIKKLDNDNRVINDLIPLALLYRMTLDP